MRAVRATGRAYLLPIKQAHALVANALRKICPTATNTGVNVLFATLLLTTAFTAGTLAGLRQRPEARVRAETYKTALSETRHAHLPDGSDIHLAPLSELSVQLSSNLRSVTLVQGEAYFDVKHDAKNPFQVRANDFVVRDLGTRFNIRTLSDRRLEVTVSEGAVALFQAASANKPTLPRTALQLSAGQSALVKNGRIIVRALSQDAIDAQLAWRARRFEFEGRPLADAVEDLNRFSARKIVIDDPSIANVEIGGSFRTDQVDLILEKLPPLFGIRHRVVERDGTQEIHLYGGSEAGRPRRDPEPQ